MLHQKVMENRSKNVGYHYIPGSTSYSLLHHCKGGVIYNQSAQFFRLYFPGYL